LGWHVVSINYRLATFEDKTTQWPAQFYDVICALEWVRRQAWCVSDRVCVAGDSAGGHLALMLGTTPNPPRLILNMFGPCDVQLMNDLLCKLPVFGGFFPPASACPVYYIGAKFPPTVTVHGEKDAVVSYSQATTLDNTLSVHGVDHKLISYGGGHEFDAVPFWKQWLIELRVMLWLWWRL
jgi:acetyl esterase/lipase